MPDISYATYGTLAQLRDQVRELDATATGDDALLLADLRRATAMIDGALPDVSFMPRVQTRYFDAPTSNGGGDTQGRDLLLDVPLRELTTVTNGDGTVLTTNDYILHPRNGAPYSRIRLTATTGYSWVGDAATGEWKGVISVAGVWAGSSIRFIAGDWISTGDSVGVAIASATTITVQVTDIDGVDEMQRTPRFSPGSLLKVTVSGSTEYLELMATSALTANPNTITVRRGARGTTALTSIPLSTPIYVWQPDMQLEFAALRQASFLYRSRGVFNKSEFDIGGGTGAKLNTSAWDSKAWEIISGYKQTQRPSFKVWGF